MKTLTLLASMAISLLFADDTIPSQWPYHVQVQITSDSGQSFAVCADEVKGEKSVVLMPLDEEDPPDRPSAIKLISALPKARLQLTRPTFCPPEIIRDYPYHGKLMHSESPFLEVVLPDDRKSKATRHNSFSDTVLPFSIETVDRDNGVITTGAGDLGTDDDQYHKRPPWLPFQTSNSFSLTLLPTLRLPEGLGDYLPDLTTWYYLLDSIAPGESQTLLLRIEGQPPLPITINRYEQQELLHYVTDAQQLLKWLTPKLNGQEVLVNQLLMMQAQLSDEAAVLEEVSEPVQELIRARLAELLDNTDHEFSLAFERFRLERDLADTFENLRRPNTGTVYEDGEADKLIMQAHNGKGTGGARGGGNSGEQKTGFGASAGRTGKDSSQQGKSSQNQQPSITEMSSQTASRATSPLVINFVGQRNAGKSSLANSLLNFTPFPVSDVEMREIEEDVNLLPATIGGPHQIRVRSLPGYGGGLPVYQWLEQYSFGSSDIVIFVSMDSIDYMDRKIIKGLLDSGFPLDRILFVRNQFDKALDPKLKELGLHGSSGEIADSIREELKDTFEKDFKSNIARIPGVDVSKLSLHFTSARDVCESDGLYLLMKTISERLLPHEEPLWREFISRRQEFSEEVYHRVSSWFIEKVKTGGEVTLYSLLNEINSIYKQAPIDLTQAKDHLARFEELFEVNPEHIIATIRENKEELFKVETEAAVQHSAENEKTRFLNDMAKTVSDEISQRGFWGKFRYLLKETGIRETLYQYFRGESAKPKDDTGAQAEMVIKKQIDGRKTSIIKHTRKYDWYDWMTTSTDKVILRIAPKIEAIVRTRFSKTPEAKETSTDKKMVQPTHEKLEKDLGYLSYQFTRYYITRFYGPAIYQRPLSEKPELEPFIEAYYPEADQQNTGENADSQSQTWEGTSDHEYEDIEESSHYQPLIRQNTFDSEYEVPEEYGDYQTLVSENTGDSEYEKPESQEKIAEFKSYQVRLRETIIAIGDITLGRNAEDAVESLNMALSEKLSKGLKISDLEQASDSVIQWLGSVDRYGFDCIIDAMRSYCDWVIEGHTPEEAFLAHTEWLEEEPQSEPSIKREQLQRGLEQLKVEGCNREHPLHK